MKKTIVLCVCAFVATVSLWAQDIIVTSDAQKIEAKIVEVSKTQIKYKEKDNPDGPTFVLETAEISSVIYANGKVVVYQQPVAKEPTVETPQAAAVATPAATEVTDYNAEILLLSGQVIKGRLMEIANKYVAYTQNGKYLTVPASQVEKVTDLRNGQVTLYQGKYLDDDQASNSSLANTAKTTGHIYRDNGEYMYNNTYISAKEVERILERDNKAAYKQWKKAEGYLVGGAVCTGIGGGLVVGGLLSLISKNYAACIGIECASLVPLSIGLGLACGASAQYNKAIDIYNAKADRAAVQLKWQIAVNGIGVALAF